MYAYIKKPYYKLQVVVVSLVPATISTEFFEVLYRKYYSLNLSSQFAFPCMKLERKLFALVDKFVSLIRCIFGIRFKYTQAFKRVAEWP